ncbi:NucA/NucB deoxyribonuclease domain-containing protein [Streptomyces sp. RB6PN25]|uniref:NucA/NucB deoxyribonuclease domain-containing protein n=1 Tax=Streptomyces humicola TaxID=2953240 RepID=A0ABT1Q2D5_9ACTN|nr:NucA/NucB deoxyribonuclease domain-containing protein [Streptomyces humicola]MCQ4084079.1 NucA/NucB deoxyribonuclease domain-containing protein [Streptomyces humicola]
MKFMRAVAAGAAALALVGGAAGTASAGSSHTVKRELSVHVSKVATKWAGKAPRGATKANAMPSYTDPTGCNNPWWFLLPNTWVRTTGCDTESYEIDLILVTDGVPEQVGEATFTTQSVTTLNTSGLNWSESFTVSAANLYGEAQTTPISLSLVAIAKPNTVLTQTGGLSGPFTLSSTKPVSGTIEYSSKVSKMQAVWDATHYILAGPPPPGFQEPIDLGYVGPEWRCDDQFWSKDQSKQLKVPGCVFPFHAAIDQGLLFPSRQYGLPGIRQNIATVQQAGVHIGRPGYGVPLHRTTEAQRIANRRAVCGRLKPPAPGLSCDEYPFASTAEGGTFYAPPNRAIAWVPRAEQNEQGGFLNALYSTNRILPGDPFYVNVFA